MLGRYTLANNVRVELDSSVSSVASSITVKAATGMFNNPPVPTTGSDGGALSIATIQNASIPPTETEIVTYTGLTDNGNGTLTLTGVSRGEEGTTARAWSANDVLFQAATAGQLSDPDITFVRNREAPFGNILTINGSIESTGYYSIEGFINGKFGNLYATLGVFVGGSPVLSSPKGGWGYTPGSVLRSGYTAYTAPSLGGVSNTTIKAAMDHIEILSKQVKALKQDLLAHGLITTLGG